MRRLPFGVLICLVLACVLPSAGRAATSFPVFGGFHSVLAYGEGENTTAAALAAGEALGSVPAADTNQLSMYEGIEQAWPGITDATLGDYYKDSSFAAQPSTSAFGSLLSGLTSTVSGEPPAAESPEAGVEIVRSANYAVPRIYADTRQEGMWAAGWVTAEDRLFQMDVLRHTAEGTTADLLGASAVPNDSKQLGLQDATAAQLTAQEEALPQTEGAAGAQALSDEQSYVAGINAFINLTKTDPTRLPAEYAALGISPQPWTLADSAAVGIYLIGQELVLSDDQAQQSEALRMARTKLGVKAGTGIYNDLRQAANKSGVVTLAKHFNGQAASKLKPASEALVDPGTLALRDAQTGGPASTPAASAQVSRERRAGSAVPSWIRSLATTPITFGGDESNAILVDAQRSGTGQALFVGGPQVDYYTPEIFLEYELHAPGIDVSGVAFPGASPYPLIGHGIDFAWTGTSAYSADQDEFAEKLCNPDGSAPSYASTHYLYDGHCIPFQTGTVTEHTPLSPTSPTHLPTTITLHTENSVHGPITYYGKVHGAPVAIATDSAARGHELQSEVAFMKLAENEVDSPQSFVQTMRTVTGGENWWYVDDKNIALLQSGWTPLRAKGTDPDFPIWGTGRWNWQGLQPATNTYRRLPDRDNPTSIDPPGGVLVNWNNQIAHGWPIASGYWSQGTAVRDSMLLDDLSGALKSGPLDLTKLTDTVTAPSTTSDLRGMADWPVIAKVLGTPTDPTLRELIGVLSSWSAAGAQRRSLTYDGNVQYGAAVLLMDAWWPLLVQAEFGPALGTPLLNFIDKNLESIVPSGLRTGTGNAFSSGFENDVNQDLRQVLGQHLAGHFSRTYCGGGSLAKCRAILRSTLLQAYQQLSTSHGTNPAAWTYPTVCKQTTPASCDQVLPTEVGAVSVAPQPLDNRGTFYQAVAVTGHR